MFYKPRQAGAGHGARGASVTLADSIASAHDVYGTNSHASDVTPLPMNPLIYMLIHTPIPLYHPHSSFQAGASSELFLTYIHYLV